MLKIKKILVTGSSGLIGSAICEKFLEQNFEVIGVDNYSRGKLLSDSSGDTRGQASLLETKYSNFENHELDFRNIDESYNLLKDVDAVVHCAAQVSHPASMEIPIEDAEINIMGTLHLLDFIKKTNPDIHFAFMSSNKVYGDYPNYFKYRIVEEKGYFRYENCLHDSFNEDLPIDNCGHTPFGVSKTAADLYVQEYGINHGLKTATFRGGCLIGCNQKAVEVHGFLGFFTKQILLQNTLNIYGNGYRVRDNIHSSDVAELIYNWILDPKPRQNGKFGKPYNIGGMRENSVSIYETILAIEDKIDFEASWQVKPERESDHIWWITDMSKYKKDYPNWKGLSKNLDFIFNELLQNWISIYDLKVDIINKTYFRDLRKN